jgi:hypothetical protein
MKRAIAAVGLCTCAVALPLIGLAAPAGAVTPVVQACVGITSSTNAKEFQPKGQAQQQFVHDPTTKPGLGDGIQALQNGDVPQSVVPNACSTS